MQSVGYWFGRRNEKNTPSPEPLAKLWVEMGQSGEANRRSRILQEAHLIGDKHFFHIARQIKSLRHVSANTCIGII